MHNKHALSGYGTGERGQLVPGGTNKSLHADAPDVNLADDLPPGMEHVSGPLARVMAELRRKMILHELAECRNAVARLREATE